MKDNLCDVDGEVDGDWSTMLKNDVERLREMQLSIAASSSVFPGFRFSPTDEELISYYLKKKLQGSDKCVDIIPEVDFCRHEPWDLPALSIIRSDNEWFFFSARGKKYPNGSQSKRATQSGYWKATGKERNVKSGGATIGTKRTLVFHMGRAPKGERTEWIMHEYCMTDTTQESLVVCRLRRNGDFRLTESCRGSCDTRNMSTPDNGDSEYENNQVDGFDKRHDDAAIKSYSKESTSSYRSSSVRQNDSESDSDRQLVHDSPHGSSTPFKEGENEDDCFADIINDDIINLDESATQSLAFRGGDLLSTKCMEKLPQESISSQGTAVRRIKLRRQKVQTHIRNLSNHDRQNQSSEGCVVSVTAGTADNVRWCHPSHLLIMVLLLLLLMILVSVAWKGDYVNIKQKLGASTEVTKRQFKYWLRKAADYI
ncbi:NAC domain-containing protein 40-like [Rutidosis leptorrhynchoides]|uniref:NAC domain-containing protein 40-like n=1 Tax=Rutidosis leptorrhynchoides TaxID=125765 RepID=UPI003A99276B